MDILLGGLVSVITLAIVKAFEIWQKSKEHKYSMQTVYFQKKLEAAETAIIKFVNEISFIDRQKLIFEQVLKNDLKDPLNLLGNKDDKSYIEIFDGIKNSVGKITLYFDFDGIEDCIYEQFLTEIQTKMNAINTMLNTYDDLIQKSIEKEQKEFLESKEETIDILISTLQETIEILNNMKVDSLRNIKTIKKEMSKYNPA